MKNFIKLLFLTLIFISCSKKKDTIITIAPEKPLVSKINSSEYSPGALTLEYDSDKRLAKVNGGFVQIPNGSNHSRVFTNQLYTTYSYKNRTVTVEDFSTSTSFSALINTRYITLNEANQILLKEIPSTEESPYKKMEYNYAEGKLSEIITTFPHNMPNSSAETWRYVENFFYDTKGNLIRTEYKKQLNGVNQSGITVRTFLEYDNAENYCQGLALLDAYFYRSLSKNNYRLYKEIYSVNNVAISTKSEFKTISTIPGKDVTQSELVFP